MSVENRATETGPSATTANRLTFRSSDDRCCPQCREIALVFDTDTGRSRCRSCGELS